MLGVRHLRQMINHKLSQHSFKEKLVRVIDAATTNTPQATVVVCSIIPNSDSTMIECAEALNYIIEQSTDGKQVVFANTA